MLCAFFPFLFVAKRRVSPEFRSLICVFVVRGWGAVCLQVLSVFTHSKGSFVGAYDVVPFVVHKMAYVCLGAYTCVTTARIYIYFKFHGALRSLVDFLLP